MLYNGEREKLESKKKERGKGLFFELIFLLSHSTLHLALFLLKHIVSF
jgi:ssRNA-specific RNase YbeY (16S rRNA maturation enzyme)